jgi:hypothetical protein
MDNNNNNGNNNGAGVFVRTRAKCQECGRVFDLMDEDDAGEWFYGHDCED